MLKRDILSVPGGTATLMQSFTVCVMFGVSTDIFLFFYLFLSVYFFYFSFLFVYRVYDFHNNNKLLWHGY